MNKYLKQKYTRRRVEKTYEIFKYEPYSFHLGSQKHENFLRKNMNWSVDIRKFYKTKFEWNEIQFTSS